MTNPSPPIFGATLLRNGLKYDYPFQECIRALQDISEEVTVALGASDDGTEASLAHFEKIHIVPTVWDENLRKGGVILSEQTNISLNEIRKRHGKGWIIYLQADELISDQDYERIRDDISRADREGYDCISFRYMHFWQSYEQIGCAKRWYPQEIRALKVDTAIESYGDAQSLRHWTKKYESDAFIYHYGHVREAGAYEKKKREFHRWWHSDEEMARVIAKGERRDKQEETLRYLGPHPRCMSDRIASHGGLTQLPRRRVLVFGDQSAYSAKFLERVEAQLEWTEDQKQVLRERPEDVVLLQPVSTLTYALSLGKLASRVPEKMRSPQARSWTPEFQALLRFSEKGVRVSS